MKKLGPDIEALLEMIEVVSKERKPELKQVGVITGELLDKFQEYAKRSDKLMRDYERKFNALKRDFDAETDTMNEMKDEFWDEVFKALNLTGAGEYQVNRETGVVSEEIKPGGKGGRDHLRGL